MENMGRVVKVERVDTTINTMEEDTTERVAKVVKVDTTKQDTMEKVAKIVKIVKVDTISSVLFLAHQKLYPYP